MKPRLLLYLTAEQLHAQLISGANTIAQRDFPATSAGYEGFAAFLQRAQQPAWLLTDLVEEDFRRETVPHLVGRNRSALLRRKFEHYYRDTPFRHACMLRRQQGGRRDDDMLFSALTRPALLTPWLDIMQQRQIPLAGIHSVAQIGAMLSKAEPSDHLLLISWEKSAGLRQTYFSERHLQLSRLTPLRDGLPFHDAVARELAHTYQYLNSLSLLPPGQTLEVRILCHEDDCAALQAGALPQSTDVRYRFAGLNEIATQLGISHRFADSDATQLYLRLLAARAPRSNYAAPAHRHFYRLWQLRRQLNWCSAALFLFSLLWAAAVIWQSEDRLNETVALDNRRQLLHNEIRLFTSGRPLTTISPAAMKAAVSTMQALDRSAPPPAEILRPFASLLDRYAQIELDELGWQVQTSGPELLIILSGHLNGHAGNQRGAQNYLEHFRSDLAAQGYRVLSLHQPLDISPEGTIVDQDGKQSHALNFSLQLARNIGRQGEAT